MRAVVRTFGCKANQYDSERMRQELEARGWEVIEGTEGAPGDAWVVNTCTVTNQADAEARSFIRRIHRSDPEARIVVAGCSAALRGPEYRSMDGVVGVVQGQDAVEVARAVEGVGLPEPFPGITPSRGPILLERRRGGSRGWLKIQDGCDRKCSFCATRLARGVSRSRSADEVIAEAQGLALHHPEIVLTGIHIGHYGVDLAPAFSLSRLVERLLDELPEVRFRLGSVEATEVDALLLELLATSGGRLTPHLHMPLQSGADPVLRRMRRWHTREDYRSRTLEIVERLASSGPVMDDGSPVLGLGADIITGFPGETDEDHAQTVALVEELPFTYLHVFPFSPRDDTVAAQLQRESPVPQRVAGERARELRELAAGKGSAYTRRRGGGGADVVLETGGGQGLTEDFLRLPVRAREGSQGPRQMGRVRWEGSGGVLELGPDPTP